jgi:hypothetical protein
MKQISSMVVLLGGLIAGYFAYPTLNSQTKPLNYEQLVKQINQSLNTNDDFLHDEQLMKQVFAHNSQFNTQYESQKQALELEKQLRETAILKTTLESLKTPEAKQALLNLTVNKVR